MNKYIDTEAEQQIVAGMLRAPDKILPLIATEMITARHFADHRASQLFKIIQQLVDDGRELHIKDITRAPEVKALNDPAIVADISEIRRKFVSIEVWKTYVPIIRSKLATRKALKTIGEVTAMIETGENPQNIASRLTGDAQKISAIVESSNSWKGSEQCSREFLEMLRKIHSKNEQYGFPTGIQEIDDETGGLMPEDFWVSAAPSSCGKTMLMMQIANHYHLEGKNVLIFSFETSAAKLISRWAAARTGIDSKALLGKGDVKLTKDDMHKIKREADKIRGSGNITICDNYDMTLESLMGIASQMREAGKPLDLIVIDYIQIVKTAAKEGRNREQEIAYITSNFKRMAKEHNCPVLSASQLNRQGAVRESDAIIQDADVLMKIDPDRGCIYMTKNRDGERGTELPLVMNGRLQRFQRNYEFHPNS